MRLILKKWAVPIGCCCGLAVVAAPILSGSPLVNERFNPGGCGQGMGVEEQFDRLAEVDAGVFGCGVFGWKFSSGKEIIILFKNIFW